MLCGTSKHGECLLYVQVRDVIQPSKGHIISHHQEVPIFEGAVVVTDLSPYSLMNSSKPQFGKTVKPMIFVKSASNKNAQALTAETEERVCNMFVLFSKHLLLFLS